DVIRVDAQGNHVTLGIAQGFVQNQGDAWSWMLDHLTRAVDALGTQDEGNDKGVLLTDYEDLCATIGTRLGEMHRVLSQSTQEPAFCPEVATAKDARAWAGAAVRRWQEALDALARREWERPEDRECATKLLTLKKPLKHAIEALARSGVGSAKIRIHGDF